MSLFIFDKDGTIIDSYYVQKLIPRTATKPERQTVKKYVRDRIDEVRAGGHKIAIASNQQSVADGIISLERAFLLMDDMAAKIGGVDTWRICPYSPKAKKNHLHGQQNPFKRDDPNRKPHPGMLIEIMQELGVPPEDTFMVGNSKEDEEAARAAGVQFVSAKKFFVKGR
jgi:D-glycero-D-manno-heptose 1,7-bisphosphate phosphatase